MSAAAFGSVAFVVATAASPGSSGLEAADGATIDFNRDIRPILSENCVHCHGPDAAKRKAGLRLDSREGAFAARGDDGSAAIVPGDPGASPLVHRIDGDDPDELMPPPESKRSLTEAQRDLLRRWIADGAPWEDHWAFRAPVRPPVPVVDGATPGDPIDAFILRRLLAENLEPLGEADRATLIRRASLDLTGLPPTPREVDAFVDDRSPDAWEQVVDRLLASPAFGEKWARHWLDLARYADSNGFQADQLRDSWAFRDWVIRAFNDDMPYDRFTIEQLAGDLLADATLDQRIATGFHRTVPCNVEAGVHPEENRVNQVIDRVNTTGTVWLGLTLECAQCHDHKYDPFSMRDYYRLFAYFNNTPLEVENPSGKGVQFDFYGPKTALPLPPSMAAGKDRLERELATLRARRDAILSDEAARARWEESMRTALANPPEWTPLPVAAFTSTGAEDHRILDDGSVLVTGNVPDTTVYTAEVTTTASGISAFRLEVLTHPDLPGGGPGRGDAERTNFVLHELSVTADGRTVDLHGATADFSQENWPVAGAVDGRPDTGWAIAPEFGKPHSATFETAEPVGDGTPVTLVFTLDQHYGRGRTIGRFRLSARRGEAPPAPEMPAAVARALDLPPADRSAKQRSLLEKEFARRHDELRNIDAAIARIDKDLAAIVPPTTLVMVEMEEPRATHVLERGSYLNPGERVEPRTPESLHPLDPSLPPNRLGLARWLVDPANPLTARVAVNRWWAELFGHGIVATLEDFGTQAEPPTHPDLLDWLAVEFMESGWSMKHVIRAMVTSTAYRRAAHLTPELAERDPDNRLLARGPRFRLPAETIRDQALAAAGLLSDRRFGPPVMPYQPPGIWRAVGRNAPKWVEDRDDDRFRRGIYVVWRRAAPYPSFVTFDAPDRGACTVARPRTNTPLQALALLNDPAYLEMAAALALRTLDEADGADARITRAFRLVLARPPRPDEHARLATLLDDRLGRYRTAPDDARRLVDAAKGTLTIPAHIDHPELAAWISIANTLLNLDETITKP